MGKRALRRYRKITESIPPRDTKYVNPIYLQARGGGGRLSLEKRKNEVKWASARRLYVPRLNDFVEEGLASAHGKDADFPRKMQSN